MRLIRAFGFAFEGLCATFRSEPAFRMECLAAAVLVPVAVYLPVSGMERVALISSVLLVLMVELLNTAVEAAVNRVSEERHPLAKKAKDAGGAAVFVSLVNAAAVWLGIILPLLFPAAG